MSDSCFCQVPVNPSLYLIKYDGFDCVYGLELHKDERVQGLEVLPDRLGKKWYLVSFSGCTLRKCYRKELATCQV